MGNTNFQTIHQMGTAISDFVKQATGRDNVQNIDMDHITVAQNHRSEEVDVSGRVVSFQAGEAGLPFEKMVVQIKPVQDLHGYDSPWPAGGGKNLYNKDADYYGQGKFWNTGTGMIDDSADYYGSSKIPIKPSTQYIRNAGATVNLFYDANGDFIKAEYTGTTITTPENAYFVAFNIGNSTNHDSVQLELGSTVTEWAPYSNICPIAGWDGVKISRTGKNLFAGYEQRTYIKPGTLYTISSAETTGAERIHLNAYNGNGEQIHPVLLQGTTNFYVSGGTTIMLAGNQSKLNAKIGLQNSDAAYIVAVDNTQTAFHHVNYNEIQLELGSTATDYEPYAGQTYDITLPSEAGTVYGGTLDVSTGELVVMSRYEDLKATASRYYLYSGLDGKYAARDVDSKDTCALAANELLLAKNQEKFTHGYIDNPYTIGADNVAWAFDNTIRLPNFGCETNEEWVAYVQSQDVLGIVYPLATPITYTLTASQVQTLLGVNNIWADTGDIEVKFTNVKELY